MSHNLVFALAFLAASAVPAVGAAEADRHVDRTAAQHDPRETESVEVRAKPEPQTDDGAKVVSGMSVLGNQEAPKSLVIVPWKSSELGQSLGISTMLDDSRQPVDKDVFLRVLSYHEIMAESTP